MSIVQKNELTPLMRQYHAIRNQYPDAVLLFQVGDFYELFFEDAKRVSAFLGIALTSRGKSKGELIPLCGVPVHARDHYLTKLIRGGFKVAICDQLEEPQPGKVVERGVTHVLTPGTLTDTKLLDEKSASYLFSFFPMHDYLGLVFAELLTAQLFATVVPASSHNILESELIRFFPDEILVPASKMGKSFQSYFKRLGYFVSLVESKVYDEQERSLVAQWVHHQFKPEAIKRIEAYESLRLALSTFYAYIRKNQEKALEHFHHLHFYQPDDFLILDRTTQRNLELIKNNFDGGRKNTLFELLDGSVTSMGSRMIKKWLMRPFIKQKAIEQRLDVVAAYVRDVSMNQQLKEIFVHIGDLERVVGRIALRRAQLYDYLLLKHALSVLPQINTLLEQKDTIPLVKIIRAHIGDFRLLVNLLVAALNEDTTQAWIIKQGFDEELDQLRELIGQSNQKIIALEEKERKETNISSLKVRYNNVHGYYIEVTKTNLHLVPKHYIRQQTLVGRERFTTSELQYLQHEMFRARNEIDQVEKKVFEHIKTEVELQISSLRKLAYALAHLDALLGLANIAYDNGYVRPSFNENRVIHIDDGRHPIVERTLQNNFIPNNTLLNDNQSLWIVTGPNMGGKSTYLRQVALICIMAQIGSFVPAKVADLAILDRIFTRIGAGDNLAEGKSTFLVEMEEAASICTQATQNSLVILDEVGRGTSTFDGLALAQAIVEYIYTQIQARCLFATHYHEMSILNGRFSGIVHYYAASQKTKDGILFLYKIIEGVADGSFGIEVAKLAGLPEAVVERAEQILKLLGSNGEGQNNLNNVVSRSSGHIEQENRRLHALIDQLQQEMKRQKALLGKLSAVDYDELSPKKAFDLLWELKDMR